MIYNKTRLWYLIPATILTIGFYVIPSIYLLIVSLFKWNGLGAMEYIGIFNYKFILSDSTFHLAIRNTFFWMCSAVFLHVPLGLLLALLVHKKPKGWKMFRVSFFLPNVISTTAIAFMWYFVFHVDAGLINTALRMAGLEQFAMPWLNSISTAIWAIQVPFIIYVGLTMVIFITQLSSIPKEIYESADIDGANAFYKDWYISIPSIKSTIGVNILLNTAFCLKMLEYPLLMTGGGPVNSTTNLSLYIYREMIAANRYGVSMAAGVVTVICGAIVLLTVYRLSSEKKA